MPEPVSPVVPGLEPFEIVFGKDQPEYRPLPALRGRRPYYAVMSRWQLTAEERKQIAEGADLYISQMTFGRPFHPELIVVAKADDLAVVHSVINEQFGYGEELIERLNNL